MTSILKPQAPQAPQAPQPPQPQGSAFDFFTPTLSPPTDYTKSTPNFENAYICANISQLCYLSSVDAKHMNIGYEEAVRSTLKRWGCSSEDIHKTIFLDSQEIKDNEGNYIPGTQGLIVFHKKTAIIGFRGSEKRGDDWVTNFKIRSRELDYNYGVSDKEQDTEDEDFLSVVLSKKRKVHRGFLLACNAILLDEEKRDLVIDKLESADNIWLTGHSLGGAIAILIANYLLEKNINVSGVYTFGAPRVGNAHYRNFMNQKLKHEYWRFMNDNDIVPDLPPPRGIYRYSREGCMLRLNKTGDTKEYDILRTVDQEGNTLKDHSYRGHSLKDHSLSEYSAKLFKLVCKNNPNFTKMEFEKLSYVDDGKLKSKGKLKLKGVIPEISTFKTIRSLLETGVSVEIIAQSLKVSPEIVEKVRDSDFPYGE